MSHRDPPAILQWRPDSGAHGRWRYEIRFGPMKHTGWLDGDVRMDATDNQLRDAIRKWEPAFDGPVARFNAHGRMIAPSVWHDGRPDAPKDPDPDRERLLGLLARAQGYLHLEVQRVYGQPDAAQHAIDRITTLYNEIQVELGRELLQKDPE